MLKKIAGYILIMLVAFLPVNAMAQKKQLSEARDYIKSGKNLDKAESILCQQLKDSAQHANLKVWDLLVQAITNQYEQGNEKLYLKQKYDTLSLFNTTRKLFLAMESMDSVDAKPNDDGKVRPKFRAKHAEYLLTIRPNLYYGGIFLVNKHEFSKAYQFFDHYINTVSMPIFSGVRFAPNDRLMSKAAYWTMYCGFKMKSDSLTMRHHALAEQDTAQLAFVMQYEAEAYSFGGDTANYVKTLRDGFLKFPKFPFFFPRLMDYYGSTEEYDSALAIADSALAVDSANEFYRTAKSTILLNMGRYDECISICKELLEKNNNLADAYYNIGLAYFNMAVMLDKVRQPYKTNRQKTLKYYQDALPYLEKYRQLAPDREDNWLSPLYTIYLNLNMGDKFDEIDKLRHEYKKNHR